MNEAAEQRPVKSKGCLFYAGLALVTLLVVVGTTVLTTTWWIKRNLDAAPLEPVTLTAQEQAAVEQKLDALQEDSSAGSRDLVPPDRMIVLTERELNGLLAHNTDLADKVYIELRKGSISAQARVPVPDDLPVLGGRILRARVNLFVGLNDDGLVVKVQDVTVGGLAIPNPWIGNIKHRNLVESQGQNEFLSAVRAGIEDFEIEKGRLVLVVTP